METYISLLRGINVGGKKPLKMKALIEIYKKMGFENIKTYLQSGNVVFQSKARALVEIEAFIEDEIKKTYDYDVKVFVFKGRDFNNQVMDNPLLRDETKDERYFHVSFLSSKPVAYDVEFMNSKLQSGEALYHADKYIYLYCPQGYGKTKLNNNFFEKKLKVFATTRNWKTVQALIKMIQES
jgi:uncharacterized protein (DUF1697 family)